MDEKRNSQRWRSVDAVPPLPPPFVCLSRTGCLLLCTCRTEYLKGLSVCECVCVTERKVQIFKCIYWDVEVQPLNNTATSKPNKMCTLYLSMSFISSVSFCLISQPTTWQMEQRQSPHSFVVCCRWISFGLWLLIKFKQPFFPLHIPTEWSLSVKGLCRATSPKNTAASAVNICMAFKG